MGKNNNARNPSKQARRAEELAIQRSNQGISWKTVIAILGSITTFVGAIVNWMDFINQFRGNYQQFLWLILVLVGVIWLIVLWLLFKQRNVYGILWLAVTIIGLIVIWNARNSYVQAREDKLIVLVAKFDGPEDIYHMRDEILKQLKITIKDYSDTELVALEQTITEAQGSKYARDLGRDENADLVIWGWYTNTAQSNLNLYFENLESTSFDLLKESNAYAPVVTREDLESLRVQQQAGVVTSEFVSLLTGYLRYLANDYDMALQRFSQINTNDNLVNKSDLFYIKGDCYLSLDQYELAVDSYTEILENDAHYDSIDSIYINRGLAYAFLQEYSLALADYNQVVTKDPTNERAFNNRGIVYKNLGEYELAISDLTQSIILNPDASDPYYNRGLTHAILRANYSQAIQDFNQAIQIQPDFIEAYIARGNAYAFLGNDEQAINDYNNALKIDPDNDITYINLGNIYFRSRDYEKALQEYGYAIKSNPLNAVAYNNRGKVFENLNDYASAVNDYSKAIELNPNYETPYSNRGLVYQKLGKIADAEADFKKYEELTGEKP